MIIAIDIGGTKIKGGLYNFEGELIRSSFELSTEKDFVKQTNSIMDQLIVQIESILIDNEDIKGLIEGIAISSAGIIDSSLGEVSHSGYTIPGYKGTQIKKVLETEFNIACTVINDVNAAAIGEFWSNNIETEYPIVYLTVGTGIGGAIIHQGKLVTGFSNAAGEIGYLPLEDKTWQELASTDALLAYYFKVVDKSSETKIDGKILFKKYDNGDKFAELAIDYFIENFCKGLTAVLYMLNPEYVIIGGGIFERDDILIRKIQEKIEALIENKIFIPKEIITAKNGNKASTLGALKYFKDKLYEETINVK